MVESLLLLGNAPGRAESKPLEGLGLRTSVVPEMTNLLGVREDTVKRWHKYGLLRGQAYNDKNQYLYEHPGACPPIKHQGRKLTARQRFTDLVSDPTQEVQCEV